MDSRVLSIRYLTSFFFLLSLLTGVSQVGASDQRLIYKVDGALRTPVPIESTWTGYWVLRSALHRDEPPPPQISESSIDGSSVVYVPAGPLASETLCKDGSTWKRVNGGKESTFTDLLFCEEVGGSRSVQSVISYSLSDAGTLYASAAADGTEICNAHNSRGDIEETSFTFESFTRITLDLNSGSGTVSKSTRMTESTTTLWSDGTIFSTVDSDDSRLQSGEFSADLSQMGISLVTNPTDEQLVSCGFARPVCDPQEAEYVNRDGVCVQVLGPSFLSSSNLTDEEKIERLRAWDENPGGQINAQAFAEELFYTLLLEYGGPITVAIAAVGDLITEWAFDKGLLEAVAETPEIAARILDEIRSELRDYEDTSWYGRLRGSILGCQIETVSGDDPFQPQAAYRCGGLLSEESPAYVSIPYDNIPAGFAPTDLLPFLIANLGEGDELYIWNDGNIVWSSREGTFVPGQFYIPEIDPALFPNSSGTLTYHLVSDGAPDSKFYLGTPNLMAAWTELPAVSELEIDIQELYIGILGRAGDRPGMEYWYEQIKAGPFTLENTRAAFTDPAQTEYTEIYGGLDNTQLVTATYENFLERAPETEGLLYWVGELDAGRVNPDQMINAVINAVRDPDATGEGAVRDLATLENKILAAIYFVAQTGDYTFDAAYQETARAVVAGVTDDPVTFAQAKAMIDEYVGK